MVTIAIWIVLILIGLSLLMLAVFGIRALTFGKVQPLSAVMIIVPVIILVVLGLVFSGQEHGWARAGIWTLVISLGLTAGAMLLSGARSIFT